VQTTGAQASEVLREAPLNNRNVDPGERQLGRQHQTCRARSDDYNRMLGHGHTPWGLNEAGDFEPP
jgi:hypothetical protein